MMILDMRCRGCGNKTESTQGSSCSVLMTTHTLNQNNYVETVLMKLYQSCGIVMY